MYVVYSVYYKFGEYDIEVFKDDDSLRQFCIKEIEEYDGDDGDDGDVNYEDIDDLINKTIEYGTKFVQNQGGFGVVSIIKGDNLVQF